MDNYYITPVSIPSLGDSGMNQSRSERASTRQGASPLRATRRMLGGELGVALATRFAIVGALAAARFATRPHRAPLRTAATAGPRAPRRDLETCVSLGHPPHE